MKSSKLRKNLIFMLGLIIVCIFGVTLAYAALSTSLSISGAAEVVASTWDVHFENPSFVTSLSSESDMDAKIVPLNLVDDQYHVESLAGMPTCGSNEDCIDDFSETTIDFVTENINLPGEYKVISVDVVNDGSIDAKLSSVILNGLSSEQDAYVNYYVQYDNGDSVSTGDVLDAGETRTIMLVIEYDKDVTVDQLPTTAQYLRLSFEMIYVQK